MPYYYKTHQTLNQNTCIHRRDQVLYGRRTGVCVNVMKHTLHMKRSSSSWCNFKFSFASDCFIRNDVVIRFLCVNNLSSQTPTTHLFIKRQTLTKVNISCIAISCLCRIYALFFSHWQHLSIVFKIGKCGNGTNSKTKQVNYFCNAVQNVIHILLPNDI